MNLMGKKVLVVGCGISGIGSTKLLEKVGANPILFDENTKVEEAAVRQRFGEPTKAQIIIGSLPEEIEKEVEMVVLSPGVPSDTAFANQFRNRKVPVIGEIELAYVCGKGKILAITGTNGKTTTTALTGKIMQEYFASSYIVGNIGNPYTDAVMEMREDTVTVAEISSFQLETIRTFHPAVSAILNITPDHLDRHHTMENYVKVKQDITQNQNKDDICVLNYEDPYTKDFAEKCPATVVYFSSARKLENGYFLEGEDIKYAKDGNVVTLMNIHEMKLLGIHNVENVMAAIAISEGFGVPREHILQVVRNFTAVEHRIEYVTTVNEVDYYNDSKGTNPDAAIKAVQAMNRPTIVIGGGYDKDSTYDEWVESFGDKVQYLILLGQTKEKIAACAKEHGFINVILVESLEDAVKTAYEKAKPGEAVLLSPACASWGMFPNYEVRGKMFKELVHKLKEL
ncbi:MAG: UDP-N-acetylmuramoyl-L-alanine--D-glutamate ligase [Lachnospiraceae bacterium]|nr:UDP-N-acetylmuramoyl-L-alanine--D-glutamate ligase [Lachnospiraceae bacterium]